MVLSGQFWQIKKLSELAPSSPVTDRNLQQLANRARGLKVKRDSNRTVRSIFDSPPWPDMCRPKIRATAIAWTKAIRPQRQRAESD